MASLIINVSIFSLQPSNNRLSSSEFCVIKMPLFKGLARSDWGFGFDQAKMNVEKA